MSRSSILLFSLVFLAFLCSQSVALPQFGGPLRTTIMNAHATSSGIIDIKRDSSNQFYVEADFTDYRSAKNSSNASNSTNSTNSVGSNPDTGRMMISIANFDTMVATSCLNFSNYDCNSYSTCNKVSYTRSIDYPTFTADIQYAQAQMYLDYNYWSINSSNYLCIAHSCSGSSSSSLGLGMYGVLGLGTGNRGSSNFGYSPIFSIYINSDLTGGKLLFKNDISSYAQSSNYVYSFYATPTWQITPSDLSIQVASYFFFMNGNVIFDINSNAIGLPESYYPSLISAISSVFGVDCGRGYTSRSYCYTSKQLKDLPDITLRIGDSHVKIPSAIYASPAGSSGNYTYFYLNFKATSPFLSGVNYVSSTFKNSIILDANFMSYYYTVFDATSGGNYIYLYQSINGISPSPPPTKGIGSGAFFLILLISIICCCCCYAKKNRPPAVVAPATVANYSYDANEYNYPGYRNAQQQPLGEVYQPYPGQKYAPPAPPATFQSFVG